MNTSAPTQSLRIRIGFFGLISSLGIALVILESISFDDVQHLRNGVLLDAAFWLGFLQCVIYKVEIGPAQIHKRSLLGTRSIDVTSIKGVLIQGFSPYAMVPGSDGVVLVFCSEAKPTPFSGLWVNTNLSFMRYDTVLANRILPSLVASLPVLPQSNFEAWRYFLKLLGDAARHHASPRAFVAWWAKLLAGGAIFAILLACMIWAIDHFQLIK